MTKYVILGLDKEGLWRALDVRGATSADQAVRLEAASINAGGTFVAVPERSWRPVKVEVHTEHKVRLAPAKPAEASAG